MLNIIKSCFTWKTILLLTIFNSVYFFAQSIDSKDVKLTGALSFDSRLLNNYDSYESKTNSILPEKKSPFLAALMSAAIPGAGEVYACNYWKAAIFVAVEAALITTNIIYNKKGDEKTKEFEEYADTYWSAARYAEWLNDYAEVLPHQGEIPKITIDSDINKKPWERVDFKEINKVEEKIGVFSHKLLPHGEQQYYELIGKYFQYKAGWEGYDGGAAYFDYYTYRFSEYADLHIKPDKIYQVASTAVVLLITNHFLSAIDAAWTTSRYNKRLQANVEIKNSTYYGVIDYYPQLNFQFTF